MKPLLYLQLLRPSQWLKNLMVFFPPFLAGTVFREGVLVSGLLPLVAFCLSSSAVYVSNDLLDRELDRAHPRKRHRLIAAERVGTGEAIGVILILLAGVLLLGLHLGGAERLCLLAYLLLSLGYTLKFRAVPILDLFCIAIGFLIRLQFGGFVFAVPVSEWLFLSVLFLALFLSAGKRLNEKVSLAESAGSHRRSLLGYPDGFLDGIMYMTGTAAMVTYTMYVVSNVVSKQLLLYSVPLCCYGLFRFLQRVQSGRGGDPTESILKDPQLFTVGLCWVFLVGWGIYR